MGIARAIANQQAPEELKMMKTKGLATEILYSLSPTHCVSKEVKEIDQGRDLEGVRSALTQRS